MVKTAKEGIKQQASNSEIYGKMQEVFIQMDENPTEALTPKTKVSNTTTLLDCARPKLKN